MRIASAAAAAYLVVAAALMAARAGLWAWGQGWARWPLFAFNAFLAAQLALNTAANLAAKSGSERYGMGAASAVGCLLCLAALWPARRA